VPTTTTCVLFTILGCHIGWGSVGRCRKSFCAPKPSGCSFVFLCVCVHFVTLLPNRSRGMGEHSVWDLGNNNNHNHNHDYTTTTTTITTRTASHYVRDHPLMRPHRKIWWVSMLLACLFVC